MGFFPRFNGAGFEPCVEVASPRVSLESIRYTSARWYVHGAAQIRRGKISGRKSSAARRDLRPTITLPAPPSTLAAPPSFLRLPPHEVHTIRWNFDPTGQFLFLEQIKRRFFEPDGLVRFREVQEKAELLLVVSPQYRLNCSRDLRLASQWIINL